ncbi:MAG: TRAP transporter small permease [Rubrivivax sp.]|nr:TRAP transporter small permease [Rubrivivax sp.]
MKRLMLWLDHFDHAAILILLSGLVAVVSLQVASRFALKIPIEWSEEIARFLFIWFCWLGSSYATLKFHHIRISAHLRLLPRRVARAVMIAGDLLWIGFNAFVVVAGVKYLHSTMEFPYRSMITDISMFWIFLPIPVIFIVFTLRVAYNLFDPHYFERSMSDPDVEAVAAPGSKP